MKKLLLICCMLVSVSAMADVYKCVLPNGEIQYNEQPCQLGKQKAIDLDARNAELRKEKEIERKKLEPILKEQKIKQMAELESETKKAREKFLLIDKAKVKGVADCQKAGCTSSEYRDLLIGRPPGMVEAVLDCRTQEIGSLRAIYCPVLLIDAGRIRNGRLQIMTGYISDLPQGVISTNRINEVNVY